MNCFIVRVTGYQIDQYGFELGQIADAYVPVQASNEPEACKRAVLWHTDGGSAYEDESLVWKSDDQARGLTFRATKCLAVSQDELDNFLSLTQGLSVAKVIGKE